MNWFRLLFYLLAALMVITTVLAITRRNPVHAVVFLILSFLTTAMLFFLLGAPLLAALEAIIYAGAIMVLFLFIIMTLKIEERSLAPVSAKQWRFPVLLALIALPLGGFMLIAGAAGKHPLSVAMAAPLQFGRYVFEAYWPAVEIISLLLFVALAGALYLGRMQKKPEWFNIGKKSENLP